MEILDISKTEHGLSWRVLSDDVKYRFSTHKGSPPLTPPSLEIKVSTSASGNVGNIAYVQYGTVTFQLKEGMYYICGVELSRPKMSVNVDTQTVKVPTLDPSLGEFELPDLSLKGFPSELFSIDTSTPLSLPSIFELSSGAKEITPESVVESVTQEAFVIINAARDSIREGKVKEMPAQIESR